MKSLGARMPARAKHRAMELNADSSGEIIKCAIRAHVCAPLPLFGLRLLPLESRKRRCCGIATAWDARLRRCAIFIAGIPGEEGSPYLCLRVRALLRAFFFDNLFVLGHDLASQHIVYKYSRLYMTTRYPNEAHS